MQNTQQIDFKMWLTYKANTTDFHKLYFLYSAVDRKLSNEYCTCTEQGSEGEVSYTVVCKDVGEPLFLSNGQMRRDFLNYLLKHYIPEQDVDQWYESKAHENNLEKKFAGLEKSSKSSNGQFLEGQIDVRPHHKESTYYNFKLAFSLLVYATAVVVLVFMLIESWASIFMLLVIVPVGLILFLMRRFTVGFLVGLIKGNAIPVTEEQFPEVYQIIKQQSKRLGLKEAPKAFVIDGGFNAFVTRLARNHILLVFSDVIATSLKGDDRILKFVIGHELGHIKRRHLSKTVWLFPSLIVPFLSWAYSRGCEYTCDRIGYAFSPRGAFEGIITLSVGKDLYSHIDPEKYIQYTQSEKSFWMWISEKFLTHPHIAKRLVEIKNYDRFSS